jgi:hypothetical protein
MTYLVLPGGIMEIALTAFVSALIVALEHYIPWRKLTGNELSRPTAYILGVLAMFIPLTILFLVCQANAILALWVVAGASGLTVMACYGVDHFLDLRLRVQETIEREERLRRQTDER